MRPLKRPMFKTGGPIKEGVMNGLRDGGVATTMADATMMAGGGMPNMRGRVTGPGGYAGKKKRSFFKPTLGGVTGSVGLDAYLDPAPYMSLLQAIGAFKDGGSVGSGLVGDPRYPQQGGRAMHNEYLKNIYQKATPIVKGLFSPTKKLKQAKAVQKIAGNVPGMLKSAVQQAGPGIMSTRQALMKNLKDFTIPYGSKIKDFATIAGQKVLKYPKTSFIAAPYVATAAKKLPFEAIGDIITHPFKQYGKVFGIGKDEPPPPPPPPGGDGTGRNLTIQQSGGPRVKTQAEIDAEKAADDKKKLDRIYSLLGVKRAQANAASKALIDMSRYIDEGGRDVISRKNIGSTISKAIGAFDKRLDKADQLKEAAGLMMAKGEIEAMSDPNKKKLQNLQIELGEDKLRPGVNSTLINSRTIKKGALTEQETIDAVRIGAANEGSELLGSITSDQIDDGNYKGKTVIDIVVDLKPEKNGYFVIGKSIVKVESGVPKLISGPLAID